MNVEMVESGLICDNPKCDWEDKTINFPEYRDWVNRPCPKCGENVLTMDDYENAEALRLVVEVANRLTPEELGELSKGTDCEEIKKTEMFKDAEGLEHLCDSNRKVSMTVKTHKVIKVTKISPTDLDGSE